MPGRCWSEEEEQKLAQMVVAGCSLDHMAETIGRPILGIKRKIKKLGLDGSGKGTARSLPSGTGDLPSAEILTHEHVLKVLAGALEKGKEAGLDSLEINRLTTLATLARTYDSILEKFRELYPVISNREIAAKLGRSVGSIFNKASQMGLKKRGDNNNRRGEGGSTPAPTPVRIYTTCTLTLPRAPLQGIRSRFWGP